MNYPDQKKEIPQATTAWAWSETGHYWTGERRKEVNYFGTKETKTHSSIKVTAALCRFQLDFKTISNRAVAVYYSEIHPKICYSWA